MSIKGNRDINISKLMFYKFFVVTVIIWFLQIVLASPAHSYHEQWFPLKRDRLTWCWRIKSINGRISFLPTVQQHAMCHKELTIPIDRCQQQQIVEQSRLNTDFQFAPINGLLGTEQYSGRSGALWEGDNHKLVRWKKQISCFVYNN